MFGRACWYSRGGGVGGGRGGRSGHCQPLRAGPGTLPSLPPSCRPGVASRALRRAHLLHEASQAPPGLHLGTLWPPGTCLPALLAQSESCRVKSSLAVKLSSISPGSSTAYPALPCPLFNYSGPFPTAQGQGPDPFAASRPFRSYIQLPLWPSLLPASLTL